VERTLAVWDEFNVPLLRELEAALPKRTDAGQEARTAADDLCTSLEQMRRCLRGMEKSLQCRGVADVQSRLSALPKGHVRDAQRLAEDQRDASNRLHDALRKLSHSVSNMMKKVATVRDQLLAGPAVTEPPSWSSLDDQSACLWKQLAELPGPETL
jgi:hypothetical protein